MNIDCEIGIRGDTCQCSALSLGCRRACSRYRSATVACRHSSALKAATFPLYLPGEACLPFTALIFLLEPLTIYSLPPPLLPPPGTALSLISSPFCFPRSAWLCLSSSFFPSLSPYCKSFCTDFASDLHHDVTFWTRLCFPSKWLKSKRALRYYIRGGSAGRWPHQKNNDIGRVLTHSLN